MSAKKGAWTWRHAITTPGVELEPITRFVLLTLSLCMNEMGTGAYPTQEQLADATGLSVRAVRLHLKKAEAAGWITRKKHGFAGQKWANHEYRAIWPERNLVAGSDDDTDTQYVEKGPAPNAAPSAKRTGTKRQKVRHQIPTILPESIQYPLPPKEGAVPLPPDVEPSNSIQFVSAALQPELWQACCKVSQHRPTMTNKDGGWKFPTTTITAAHALLPASVEASE